MSEGKPSNKELMILAGSAKGEYDPEAPGQWRWVLRHGETTERAMAWVKSKTTAYRHESPFCIDEQGNPLDHTHLAADMGWKPRTARNVLAKLNGQGRIRLEEGKRSNRIWYRADVPEGRTKGDKKDSVQSHLAGYLADFIESLPEEQRAAATLKVTACSQWKRDLIADGMAALRSIADQVEDTTLQELGIPKKRLPKRRDPETKWVQLSLLAQPGFLSTLTAPVKSPAVDDVVPVSQKLVVKKSVAQKFLADCRRGAPGCTVEAILEVIDQTEASIDKRRYPNFTPILLETVPLRMAARQREAEAQRARDQAQRQDAETRATDAQRELETYEARERYDAFLSAEAGAHIESQPQPAIERRLRDHMARIQQGAPQYRWPEPTLRGFALRKLREEVAIELGLPTFEQFRAKGATS